MKKIPNDVESTQFPFNHFLLFTETENKMKIIFRSEWVLRTTHSIVLDVEKVIKSRESEAIILELFNYYFFETSYLYPEFSVVFKKTEKILLKLCFRHFLRRWREESIYRLKNIFLSSFIKIFTLFFHSLRRFHIYNPRHWM